MASLRLLYCKHYNRLCHSYLLNMRVIAEGVDPYVLVVSDKPVTVPAGSSSSGGSLEESASAEASAPVPEDVSSELITVEGSMPSSTSDDSVEEEGTSSYSEQGVEAETGESSSEDSAAQYSSEAVPSSSGLDYCSVAVSKRVLIAIASLEDMAALSTTSPGDNQLYRTDRVSVIFTGRDSMEDVLSAVSKDLGINAMLQGLDNESFEVFEARDAVVGSDDDTPYPIR